MKRSQKIFYKRLSRFILKKSLLNLKYNWNIWNIITVLGIVFALVLLQKYDSLSASKTPHMISGKAFIIDGDTLKIKGEKIRLYGMDAPELKQICTRKSRNYACGEVARQILYTMTEKQIVTCTIHAKDHYGRPIGKCSTAEHEINRDLVKKGWAVSYGAFKYEESAARKSRIGLWAGDFQKPYKWRIRQKNKKNKYMRHKKR